MVLWFFRLLYVAFLTLFLFLLGVFAFEYTTIWFYLGIVGALVLAFIVSFITTLAFIRISAEFRKHKPIDDQFNHRFTNSILILARKLLRIKVIVSGREHIPNKPFVMVSNHQENYDIIVLKPVFENLPFCFIAKEALFKTPIIGKWVTILGSVPITREADRAAAEAIVKGIKIYKQGLPMGIFPEGRRSFSNEMIQFKAGAFKLAMKPKADILIVTLYDVGKTFKCWPFVKQKVYVHIHPLLTYDEYKEKNSQELADFVKDIIQIQLDTFKKTIG